MGGCPAWCAKINAASLHIGPLPGALAAALNVSICTEQRSPRTWSQAVQQRPPRLIAHAHPHISTHNIVPAARQRLLILSSSQAVRTVALHGVIFAACVHDCMHVCSAARRSAAQNSELRGVGSEHCVPLGVPLCVDPMGIACFALSPAGWVSLKYLANERNGIRFSLIWFFFFF